MDNAVVVNAPTPLVPANGLGARLAAMPAKAKFSMGLGLAALAAWCSR